MAKKRKNALFEDSAEQDISASATESTMLSAIADDTYSDYAGSDTQTEEIGELGALKLEVKRLNEENAQLTDKLASYIEAQQDNNANDCCISAELSKLQNENNTLRDENDKYLMKISELTFENAKLTSQLQTLSKDTHESNVPIQAKPCGSQNSRQKVMSLASSNVSYVKANGYTSWN